ncbi:MAG: hotdog fold domain-containing protein [Myxococcota bacterium]
MSKTPLVDVAQLRQHWERFSALPGGKALFSKALGLMAPYTATIDARIEEMRPGFARAHLVDRRKVRNHLHSVHAIALANLAELTGNLALIAAMPPDARMIITGLSIAYLKKARGKITAVAESPIPKSSERQEYEVQIRLENPAREVIATAKLKSLLGPKE